MTNVRCVPALWEAGGTWAACDRCGQKYRLRELRREWSGLMVCPSDYDPRPDTLQPPALYPEGLAVRNARPEPPDTFVNMVTPDQL